MLDLFVRHVGHVPFYLGPCHIKLLFGQLLLQIVLGRTLLQKLDVPPFGPTQIQTGSNFERISDSAPWRIAFFMALLEFE